METGEEWDLVFSDEFNRDGRSFYPGDDPYWEAEDYHYWGTENLNWYDPAFITTRNGSLVIRLDKYPQHDLDYTGGLMSTWNRFCFTGGYIETRLTLPGRSDVAGLWPAVWTLGNLGRAGYGGTLEGMWPYTYDSCDRGTLPNQTLNGLPKLTYDEGDVYKDGDFNYLPGQRLSRCTCQNSASQHPGPKHDDGSFVGRSAPEIDIIEAQVGDADEEGDHTGVWSGHVSMSGQWAPFNPGYRWLNSSEYFTLYNKSAGWINTYQGGTLQQSTSVLMKTNQDCYEMNTGCMSIYGFEYEPTSKGYISWVNDGQKAFTVRGGAMGPNARANVSERPVPEEPMYIVMNLGISEAFGGAK
jgi:beta-glucanase (GH16 family)